MGVLARENDPVSATAEQQPPRPGRARLPVVPKPLSRKPTRETQWSAANVLRVPMGGAKIRRLNRGGAS